MCKGFELSLLVLIKNCSKWWTEFGAIKIEKKSCLQIQTQWTWSEREKQRQRIKTKSKSIGSIARQDTKWYIFKVRSSFISMYNKFRFHRWDSPFPLKIFKFFILFIWKHIFLINIAFLYLFITNFRCIYVRIKTWDWKKIWTWLPYKEKEQKGIQVQLSL